MLTKPIKILVATQSLIGSGGERFLKNLIAIHLANNIQTAVCCADEAPHLQPYFKEKGIRYFRSRISNHNGGMKFRIGKKEINLPLARVFYILYDFLSILKAVVQFRPQVILVSNAFSRTQFGIFLYPQPVIYFSHSLMYGCEPAKARFIRYCTRSGHKNILATVSIFAAESIFRSCGVAANKQWVIPNAVPLHTKNQIQKGKPKIILTVGDFVDYKNPHIWYEVAKKVVNSHPGCQFIWVGKGPLLDAYKAKAIQDGYGEKIICAGYSTQVEQYYSKASICFHPSLAESQGLALLEAMSHGLPCVASRVGGIPESVVPGETGFLCAPTDIDAFAQNIGQLLQEETLYDRLAENAYQRIKNNFTPAKYQSAILDMYREVLPKKYL